MKIYQICADLTGESQDDIYPIVPVCSECVLDLDQEGIVQEISEFDPNYGDKCYYCGKFVDEDNEEIVDIDRPILMDRLI